MQKEQSKQENQDIAGKYGHLNNPGTSLNRTVEPEDRGCEIMPAPIQANCEGINATSTKCRPFKMREIMIEQVSRGYIVRVGCATIAIGAKSELINYLVQYISDPETIEKAWNEGKLFQTN